MSGFDIVIVGGGLVGLGASIALAQQGHRVRILEASTSLQIVGDSVTSTANHTRVLERWGLLDRFREVAPRDLGVMQHRRYSTDEVIGRRDMESQASSYGHPSYILSRKGYQQFLFDEASKLGVVVCFDSRIAMLDDDSQRPAVTTTNGSRFEADVVIGCDGVRSTVRAHLFPEVECLGHVECYRAVVPSEELINDADLVEFTKTMNFWMGPDRLAIQSNMADIGSVALNLYHPSNIGKAGFWKAPGDVQQMREDFADFGPSMQKLLSLVRECINWKVVDVPPLSSWVSRGGRVILIGDAAHAVVPYSGQGCALGMEDAATLGECLARAKSAADLPRLLRICEDIRKPRAEVIARSAATIGKIWMMPDGPSQVQRDEKMRHTPLYSTGDWDGKPIGDILPSLLDPLYQPWVMSHDAVAYARRRLDDLAI